MNDQSKMCDQTTFADTPNAISSPVLESGHTLSAEQDGVTTGLYGQAPALASLSHRQAKAMGLLMSATCGQPSTTSSNSASLQSSLENRLKQRSAILGSTLFKLTWKKVATPLGRSVSLLRASALRTSVPASSLWEQKGWPTCTKTDAVRGVQYDPFAKNMTLNMAATLGAWPTPTTPSGGQKPPEGTSATGRAPDGRKVQVTLKDVAVMSVGTWATSQAFDATGDGAPRALRLKNDCNRDPNQSGSYRGELKDWAGLASWPTPTTRDWKDGVECENVPLNSLLGRVVWLADPARLTDTGETPTGFHAEIPKSARLNPALPRWLMGLPPEWDLAAPSRD